MSSNRNGNGNGNGYSNDNDARDHAKDYSTVDLTAEELSKVLINYVSKLRPGLLRFYDKPDDKLSVNSEHVQRAVTFANFMKGVKPVGREGALGLSVLTLYDLVMLVGTYIIVTCFYYLAIDGSQVLLLT